jgi:hypothetical protein
MLSIQLLPYLFPQALAYLTKKTIFSIFLRAVQRPIEGENILGVQIRLIEKGKNKICPSLFILFTTHILCCVHNTNKFGTGEWKCYK